MTGSESGARRCRERRQSGVAAGDPRSYDLPDFRTLGDGPYPPILLEAFERAGNGFRPWSEQVQHAGYCCRPIRIRGRVEQVDRATGEVRGVYSTEGEPAMTCCSLPAGAVGPLGAVPHGTCDYVACADLPVGGPERRSEAVPDADSGHLKKETIVPLMICRC